MNITTQKNNKSTKKCNLAENKFLPTNQNTPEIIKLQKELSELKELFSTLRDKVRGVRGGLAQQNITIKKQCNKIIKNQQRELLEDMAEKTLREIFFEELKEDVLRTLGPDFANRIIYVAANELSYKALIKKGEYEEQIIFLNQSLLALIFLFIEKGILNGGEYDQILTTLQKRLEPNFKRFIGDSYLEFKGDLPRPASPPQNTNRLPSIKAVDEIGGKNESLIKLQGD